MKLCTDTITVFNARVDPATGYDDYLPTVIVGVSWYMGVATSVNNNGLQAANACTIRIPLDADFGGKSYADPIEYAGAADPAGLFTLQPGDIVIKGSLESSSLRPAEIKRTHATFVTIKGVTDNRRAPNAPHWKVLAT